MPLAAIQSISDRYRNIPIKYQATLARHLLRIVEEAFLEQLFAAPDGSRVCLWRRFDVLKAGNEYTRAFKSQLEALRI